MTDIPNDYRDMVPEDMRTHTDRLMAAVDSFARVLFVTTGGNCTALEVRPRGGVPTGEHLLITNGDAQAPLLDLDGHGPDLEIMVGACHDDPDLELQDDPTVFHHTYNDADTAIAMVLRVVLSWLSARDMAERLRTLAAEILTVPMSVRYVPTLNGVAVEIAHPVVVGSAMVVTPPTAWRVSLHNGGELVTESPDPDHIADAIGEWLSV